MRDDVGSQSISQFSILESFVGVATLWRNMPRQEGRVAKRQRVMMPQQQHPMVAPGMLGAMMPGMMGVMPGMFPGAMPGMMPGGMPGLNPMMGGQMMGGQMMGGQMMGGNMMSNNMMSNNVEEDSESEEVLDVQQQPTGTTALAQPIAAPPVSANPAASGSDSAAPAVVQPTVAVAPQLNFTPYGNSGIYNKDDTAAVTRASSVLRGLPRTRIAAALEKLDPEIDAGFVASLSMRGLLILLWMFTRIRPATKVCHLRFLAI